MEKIVGDWSTHVEMTKEHEWYLTWSGMKDTPENRSAFEHCRQIRLFKDSKAKIIDFAEYVSLVDQGKIKPPTNYWQIKEGQIGVITLQHYQTYRTSWGKVGACRGDFLAGWKACSENDLEIEELNEYHKIADKCSGKPLANIEKYARAMFDIKNVRRKRKGA